MNDWIYQLGFYGPFLLFVTTIILLIKQPVYLLAYVILFTNLGFVNKKMKMFFREPRPNVLDKYNTQYDSNVYKNEEQYGMPSGHSQSCIFSTFYSWLVLKNTKVIILQLFVTFLTLFQRWKFRRHTINQLVVGGFVGAFFAFLLFICVKKMILIRKNKVL